MAEVLKDTITWLGLDDCTVKPSGGTEVDLPGIESVSIKPGTWNTVVRGDNMVIAQAAGLNGEAELEFINAVFPLKLIMDLIGSSYEETGATPNAIGTAEFNANGKFKEFQLETQCKRIFSSIAALALPGDCHIVVPKIQIIDFPPIVFGGWEFKSFNFKARAVSDPTDADGMIFKIVTNETAVALLP